MIIFRLPIMFARLLVQSVFLALGQIWANKVRAVLTAIGIIIGVASVTTVIAVLTGLKATVLSEFEQFGTNKMYIIPHRPAKGPKRDAPWHEIRFTPDLFEDFKSSCPSVAEMTRIGYLQSPVRFEERTIENVRVMGIDPAWHVIEQREIKLGRPFSVVDLKQGRPVCLIPAGLRDKLGLRRDCTGESVLIFRRRYRIVGVVESQQESGLFNVGGDEVAEIQIPFTTAWKTFRPWMLVIASIKSPEVADEAASEVRHYLRSRRGQGPGDPDTFRVEVMQKFIEQFKIVAMAITIVAAGIVGISLLVGGVGIMNIMLVSVSERTREIGLRKAVGAKPTAILLQFLVEAVMLCFFGGAMGVAIGAGLTKALAAIPGAKLDKAFIPMWAIALSFGFAAAVGVFFGMFPAVKAARLDPIEALRHE